jgi:Fibronectin type III domain
LRLIRAAWVPALVSLALMGCGGSDVAVNSPTANETAPSSGTSGGSGSPATPVTATATLSWKAPTSNTDGSPLANLAGYNIYYGTDSSALTQTIQVANAAALGYVVSGLAKGTTWYFQVTSYTTGGQESAPSPVTTKST